MMLFALIDRRFSFVVLRALWILEGLVIISYLIIENVVPKPTS